jgi:hypothetical protein
VARGIWAEMGGARGRGRGGGGSPLQSFKMSLAPLCEETVHTHVQEMVPLQQDIQKIFFTE